MSEERTREEGYNWRDAAEEHSFDQLARGLASGTVSRKHALKLVGGALLGGVLASIPGVALAQRTGGNTACDEFCHTVFSGRQAGECVSIGARGEGPCFECTPGVGPGPNFTPPECDPRQTFNEDTCQCETVSCTPPDNCGPLDTCGETTGPGGEGLPCYCVTTTEGTTVCVGANTLSRGCTSSADCFTTGERESFCAPAPCGLQGNFCVRRCETEDF